MKDFPWFKFYPALVEKEVDCNAYSSVNDLFEESVKKFSSSVAYECMGKTLSFSELDRLSAHFANYLTQELKLAKGSRVAIQMPNVLQYPVVMFGALRAGMVVVNTNPLYTPSEMKHQFNDSGADVVVIVADASTLKRNLLFVSQIIDLKIPAVLALTMMDVARKLAQAIVRDGEGATKFITIQVDGGRTAAECLQAAYAVAHSPLVKTAFFASDPNLGRILAAVGYAGIHDLDVSGIELHLGDVHVVKQGGRNPDYREEDGQRVMKAAEILVRIGLGRGNVTETVWTCDFSHDYVTINADYRS